MFPNFVFLLLVHFISLALHLRCCSPLILNSFFFILFRFFSNERKSFPTETRLERMHCSVVCIESIWNYYNFYVNIELIGLILGLLFHFLTGIELVLSCCGLKSCTSQWLRCRQWRLVISFRSHLKKFIFITWQRCVWFVCLCVSRREWVYCIWRVLHFAIATINYRSWRWLHKRAFGRKNSENIVGIFFSPDKKWNQFNCSANGALRTNATCH